MPGDRVPGIHEIVFMESIVPRRIVVVEMRLLHLVTGNKKTTTELKKNHY